MRRGIPSVLALVTMLAACTDRAGTPLSPEITGRSDAKAPQPTVVNVTTVIYDQDGVGSLLTRSDDFNGTGSATYTTINKITSHVASDGSGWQLYLGNQTARTIRLTLASQGIPLPDGNYSANVEVYSACFDAADVKINLLTMTAGEVNHNCSFGVDFSVGRTKYKLTMGSNWPGTGRASVTCNASNETGCTSWTIATDPTVANAGVANLYGPNGLAGAYQNSFSVSYMR